MIRQNLSVESASPNHCFDTNCRTEVSPQLNIWSNHLNAPHHHDNWVEWWSSLWKRIEWDVANQLWFRHFREKTKRLTVLWTTLFSQWGIVSRVSDYGHQHLYKARKKETFWIIHKKHVRTLLGIVKMMLLRCLIWPRTFQIALTLMLQYYARSEWKQSEADATYRKSYFAFWRPNYDWHNIIKYVTRHDHMFQQTRIGFTLTTFERNQCWLLYS